MKLLALFFALILLTIPAYATAVSITIRGTNASNAQLNVTCYGCNNSINVSAWNTSYVKNISVNSNNGTGGDVVSFNISNVTAYQVQELRVNGTSVNGYQAGANGMLNFSYTVIGNRTLTLSPAVNQGGANVTWSWFWNQTNMTVGTSSSLFTTVNTSSTGRAANTVYQNTNTTSRFLQITGACGSTTQRIFIGTTNPPNILTSIQVGAAGQDGCYSAALIPANWYYNFTVNNNFNWAEWN